MNQDDKNNFNMEVCRLTHVNVDKEIEAIRKHEDDHHEEIKKIIDSLGDNLKKDIETNYNNLYNNLKDKIVLTEKTLGDKIDKLNEFDNTLKGNGKPGIWESIRSLRSSVKIMTTAIVLIVILELGGSFRGITWEKIKEKMGIREKIEIQQIDEVEIKEMQSETEIIEIELPIDSETDSDTNKNIE
jgi:hypothetical protein